LIVKRTTALGQCVTRSSTKVPSISLRKPSCRMAQRRTWPLRLKRFRREWASDCGTGLYVSMIEGPSRNGFYDLQGSLMGHRALGLAVRHPPCYQPLSAQPAGVCFCGPWH
jgi:hypothetical protein